MLTHCMDWQRLLSEACKNNAGANLEYSLLTSCFVNTLFGCCHAYPRNKKKSKFADDICTYSIYCMYRPGSGLIWQLVRMKGCGRLCCGGGGHGSGGGGGVLQHLKDDNKINIYIFIYFEKEKEKAV